MGVKGLIDFDFTHSFIYSPICLFLLTYSLVWMNKNYYLFIQSSYDFDAFILYVLIFVVVFVDSLHMCRSQEMSFRYGLPML